MRLRRAFAAPSPRQYFFPLCKNYPPPTQKKAEELALGVRLRESSESAGKNDMIDASESQLAPMRQLGMRPQAPSVN